MKYLRPHEIIHSKEFLREPVNDTYKEIESLPTSKIILRGEGTGRSTLLYYMQDKKSNTEQPFIRLNFAENFYSEINEIFTKEFFEHYWELRFSRKLLWYIRDYYEMIYHSDFSKYSDFIYDHLKQIDKFRNESIYKEDKFSSKMFSTKEISGEILDKFKKLMHIESVELGIDSFDSINSEDEISQKILYSYYDLFDKTIIVGNDDSLPQEWYETYLKEDSELFTFVPYTIEYGKYLEIIYNIIEKRVNEYNSSLYEECKNNNCFYKPFPLDWLDYDTLKLLRNKTNGNIRLILDIINKLSLHWKLNFYILPGTIERIIKDRTNNEIMKKVFLKDPKLHL